MTALQTTINAAPANINGDHPKTASTPDNAALTVSPKTWLAVFGATLGSVAS